MNPILKVLLTPIGGKPKAAAPTPAHTPRRLSRRFDRFQVPVAIIARCGRRQVSGTTASLGLGGLFISCSEPFATQTQVNLTINGKHGEISARGKVVYLGSGGMGIRFTGLTTNESYQLKSLCTKAPRLPVS
jgi:hypothetical protein